MKAKTDTKDIGLRGVPVADSRICLIDGKHGNLFFRGYNINDLAEHSTYEEVAYLLIYEDLPSDPQLKEFTERLKSERNIAPEINENLKALPKTMSPMDVLQSSMAVLAGFDPELSDESKEANQRKACRILSKIPTIIAAWDRIRKNLSPVNPRRDLTHAENLLYTLRGKTVDQRLARYLDKCLILHAEHSFNASTFAARVVASTRAHIYASTSAAVGALSGELHGGANARVMRNLLEIGDPDKVDEWVKSELDKGNRIMGMGHAVYETTDPRARILRGMSKELAAQTGEPKWYAITKRIEEVTQREIKERRNREIYPNVDLYSASTYYMIGITPDLYPAVFAASRIAGWTAHVLEEKFPTYPAKPVLYRPSAEYQGNYCGPIGCTYVPLKER